MAEKEKFYIDQGPLEENEEETKDKSGLKEIKEDFDSQILEIPWEENNIKTFKIQKEREIRLGINRGGVLSNCIKKSVNLQIDSDYE